MLAFMRVSIRVRPGSGRTLVGGRHDESLVVRVRERAIDGKATAAALRALVEALEVGARDVTLVSGARNRTKIVDIPDEAGTRFLELRDS
jgi:uncharacterized protein YggU (UPF0235/DUF167 family)